MSISAVLASPVTKSVATNIATTVAGSAAGIAIHRKFGKPKEIVIEVEKPSTKYCVLSAVGGAVAAGCAVFCYFKKREEKFLQNLCDAIDERIDEVEENVRQNTLNEIAKHIDGEIDVRLGGAVTAALDEKIREMKANVAKKRAAVVEEPAADSPEAEQAEQAA